MAAGCICENFYFEYIQGASQVFGAVFRRSFSVFETLFPDSGVGLTLPTLFLLKILADVRIPHAQLRPEIWLCYLLHEMQASAIGFWVFDDPFPK